jgi:hypothetical protein
VPACYFRPARPGEQASLNSPLSGTSRGRPTLCATGATTEIILPGPDGPDPPRTYSHGLASPAEQAAGSAKGRYDET